MKRIQILYFVQNDGAVLTMNIKIITKPIPKSDLAKIAKDQFGDWVKAVVDVERRIMAIGGDLHADEETILLQDGSEEEYLWGINFWLDKSFDEWIEFNSMINIRPSQHNRSRGVEDESLRQKIKEVVGELVTF